MRKELALLNMPKDLEYLVQKYHSPSKLKLKSISPYYLIITQSMFIKRANKNYRPGVMKYRKLDEIYTKLAENFNTRFVKSFYPLIHLPKISEPFSFKTHWPIIRQELREISG